MSGENNKLHLQVQDFQYMHNSHGHSSREHGPGLSLSLPRGCMTTLGPLPQYIQVWRSPLQNSSYYKLFTMFCKQNLLCVLTNPQHRQITHNMSALVNTGLKTSTQITQNNTIVCCRLPCSLQCNLNAISTHPELLTISLALPTTYTGFPYSALCCSARRWQ